MRYSESQRFSSLSFELFARAAFQQTRSSAFAPRPAFSRFVQGALSPAAGVQRKRRSTRLLQPTHTARLSRRLLATAEPGSRRASHTVCLGRWWLGRFRIQTAQRQQPIHAFQELPVPSVSTSRRLWTFFRLMPSPTAGISDSEAQAFTSQPSYFGIVVESLSYNRMTPNHALQRTAPRVTARAFCERSGSYIWASFVRATVGHAPRHAPPSLSLGSLADARLF